MNANNTFFVDYNSRKPYLQACLRDAKRWCGDFRTDDCSWQLEVMYQQLSQGKDL